jgi:Trk K+ transport system NAD-binding subunit
MRIGIMGAGKIGGTLARRLQPGTPVYGTDFDAGQPWRRFGCLRP